MEHTNEDGYYAVVYPDYTELLTPEVADAMVRNGMLHGDHHVDNGAAPRPCPTSCS